MRRRSGKFLLILAAGLILLRLALPSLLKWYVNRTLDRSDGYAGHVEDVDLALWRGAYRLQDLKVRKKEGGATTPFFSAETIDISVEWKQIWRRRFVCEFVLEKPILHFVSDHTEKDGQNGAGGDWLGRAQDLTPIKINRVEIEDGEIFYTDKTTQPEMLVGMDQVDGQLNNLTNSRALSGTLVAGASVTAHLLPEGNLRASLLLDPYSHMQSFRGDFELKDLNITRLNPMLRKSWGVDVERGTISIYSELKAEDGELNGYVKPFIKDAKVFRWGEKTGGFVNAVKEIALEISKFIVKNPKEETVAVRAPLKGSIDKPGSQAWPIIRTMFRHAFIQALSRSFSNRPGP